MKRIAAISACSLLCACASINTGEIEYRRAEQVDSADVAKAIKAYPDGCRADGRRDDCAPLLPARLFRQNLGTGVRIGRSDVYSIRLDHAVIANMSEAKFSIRRLGRADNPFRAVGEVVVLANAFEFPNGEDAADAPRFLELSDLSQAKVIYYSPDVEEGQDLNFSNIVLQAPKVYNGNPVGVQLIVIELDRVSTQVQGLLKQLAALGQNAEILPGGAAADLLLELGGSLLSQNHDDVIFEYRFVMDPSSGAAEATSPPFEAGKYVLLRLEERKNQQIWRNFHLDHNTGKLMVQGHAGKTTDQSGEQGLSILASVQALKGEETAERGSDQQGEWMALGSQTYFTMNVIKHPAGTEASNYALRTYGDFDTEITEAMNDRDRPIGEVTTAVTELVQKARSRNKAADLRKAWTRLAEQARAYAQSIAPNVAPSNQCVLRPGLAESMALGEAQTKAKAIQFALAYGAALTEQKTINGVQEAVFTDADQRSVLAGMFEFFAPFSAAGGASQATLLDLTKFKTTYVDKPADFAEAIVAEAEAEGTGKNCDDLIRYGLAKLPDA